jgi:Clathrin light chain
VNPTPSQPTFGAVPPFAPRPQPSALSATPILTQPIDAEEPEVIRSVLLIFFSPITLSSLHAAKINNRQWRERQAEEIKVRDERSKAHRQETISKAERAIDQFYEDYNGMRKRQIRDNKCVSRFSASHLVEVTHGTWHRDSEAEYLASLTDSLSRGTTWDRICDLVELENSQSKTLARAGPGTTELSRYREVLLRLRREGAGAPGAAGY